MSAKQNFNVFIFWLIFLLTNHNNIFAQSEWFVDPFDYEFSMTITCLVVENNSNYFQEEISIGVFDNNQCVGFTTTNTYFSPFEANLGFLVVFSNQLIDNYTIKVIVDNQIIDAGELNFEANGILGSLEVPFIISPNYTVYGCTNQLSLNFNPNATLDDGSCIEYILGCTDQLAYNYDINATVDDNSCIPVVIGCMDNNFIEYDQTANSGDQEMYCLNEIILGCMNDDYVEYNSQANFDNGSCTITWQQAYLSAIQECENNSESNIIINIPIGWSIIGFTKNESIDISDAMYCIVDKILIVKDYLGAVYIPDYSFNGIGNLDPGIGYQIKLTQEVEQFNFCN